jgi:hypothetical protein
MPAAEHSVYVHFSACQRLDDKRWLNDVQFTMLNDCMLMSQTLANWTFFFDVDEFLYIPRSGAEKNQPTIQSILAEKARNNVTQIRFQTVKVSDGLCLKQNRLVSDSEFVSQISR